jgi:acyl-CoA synthetase (AMP-forming)/AMP-acid ligase II
MRGGAVKIDSIRHAPEQIAAYRRAGYWTDGTTVDLLERQAREQPNRLALVDARVRLGYASYAQRSRRLASLLIGLGLTSDDVIALQLPNWTEFAIVVNAAMLAGIPFCQVHSDFRSREIEFVLRYTGAAVFICPVVFRRFDYLAMVREVRPALPGLRHVMAVGSDVPDDIFDLRMYLDQTGLDQTGLDRDGPVEVSDSALRARRPHGDDLARVAFTSGTTGDPKAVMHLHNTTNSAIRFANRGHAITRDSVVLVFLPAGMNWGLLNVLQALEAGCALIMLDVFDAVGAMRLIERERVSYFCCAPAHLVAMLNSPDIERFDLRSLQTVVTGGASCPIEVIRAFRTHLRGDLLELYGMLETGFQSWTRPTDDPEAVCGTCGPVIPEVQSKILDEHDRECPPDAVGEILSHGPSVTIGYYNNPDANARSFTADGWFRTGDLGTFDAHGLLRIVGRKKEMIIRGGANIYPREIEEVLYQHPDIIDAAVIGIPDARLGERTCACVVPRAGRTLGFDDVVGFLRPKIATYKLPEVVEVLADLPRTPTGKIQKEPLRALILGRLQSSQGTTAQGTTAQGTTAQGTTTQGTTAPGTTA